MAKVLPGQQVGMLPANDFIFVFEFEESFRVNSICLHALDFNDALVQFSLILGESSLHHVQCVRHLF